MLEREGLSSQSSPIKLSPGIQKAWAQLEKLNAALAGGNFQLAQEAAKELDINLDEITTGRQK